jgi:RNA polymerase sigma-70 factor (ECF subfamily)
MRTERNGAAGPVAWGRQIEAVATRRDRAAFIALFQHFAPRVKTFMLRSGANEAMAEEIAQETMLTVWRKADLFAPSSHDAAAWIFAIARNLRIDGFRRQQRDRAINSEGSNGDTCIEPHVVDEHLTAEAQLAVAQSAESVHKAMAQLSDEQMRAIQLSFFEQKTHSEIAEHLQIPLGTVKSRLRLALARLRALLGQMS